MQSRRERGASVMACMMLLIATFGRILGNNSDLPKRLRHSFAKPLDNDLIKVYII